jgi:hypothetical protein
MRVFRDKEHELKQESSRLKYKRDGIVNNRLSILIH